MRGSTTPLAVSQGRTDLPRSTTQTRQHLVELLEDPDLLLRPFTTIHFLPALLTLLLDLLLRIKSDCPGQFRTSTDKGSPHKTSTRISRTQQQLIDPRGTAET